MVSWERARSEEQIEYRVNEILDATARLYESHRYEEITFVMIAREAGFTRSNLYRYFKTREDIFLRMLARDIIGWRGDLERNIPTGCTSGEFSELWVRLIMRRRRMLEIFAILYTLLEKNASLEGLVEYKKTIMSELNAAISMLTALFPGLTAQKADEFIQSSLALSIGIYPQLEMTERQNEAMKIVGMDINSGFYRDIWVRSVESILSALLE